MELKKFLIKIRELEDGQKRIISKKETLLKKLQDFKKKYSKKIEHKIVSLREKITKRVEEQIDLKFKKFIENIQKKEKKDKGLIKKGLKILKKNE